MVGKRRKHKTVVPYRRVVGSGAADLPELIEKNDLGAPAMPDTSTPSARGTSTLHSSGAKSAGSAVILPDSKTSIGSIIKIDAANPTIDPSLPSEIVDLICKYCTPRFPLLFVCWRWYFIALRRVYAVPALTPYNYALFVEAISRDRKLGSYVRELDLTRIAQVGEKSMTSRLLRRCSPRLEKFVATQSHFGLLPMISLGACEKLTVLDLSLVSETVNLPMLFTTISRFRELEILHFPRSSIECPDDAEMLWASNLRMLGLSGGFPARFLETTVFPSHLTELQISNCPHMTTAALIALLHKIGPQLARLLVVYPVPLLAPTAMDSVFYLCPNLVTLHVSIDYVSNAAFDPDLLPLGHPLRTLVLLSSGLIGHGEKVRASDVLMATEGLEDLRRLSVSLLMGWNPDSSALLGLVDVLTERGGGVWMK